MFQGPGKSSPYRSWAMRDHGGISRLEPLRFQSRVPHRPKSDTGYLLVFGNAGCCDVGVQHIGKKVVAGHSVLLTAFLVYADQPAGAFRLQILYAHLQRCGDTCEE